MTTLTTHSRGFEISFEDDGEGLPLMLVNGYASPAVEWRDAGYVARLVDRYRVISVDSLGHGASEKSYEWRSYLAPDVSLDLIAVLDHLGLERAALWGYSRGAGLVAMAAAEHPHRVAALVAGGFTWSSATDSTDEISATTEALQRGDWVTFWERLGAPVSEADREYMQQSSDPRALAAVQIGRQRSRYELDFGRISAPTLLYYGGADTQSVGAGAEKVGVQPLILEGDHDHFAAFSDAETVVPAVRAFLDDAYRSSVI
jgi:pimeloyl-ACP methyl ester carboxylesterase